MLGGSVYAYGLYFFWILIITTKHIYIMTRQSVPFKKIAMIHSFHEELHFFFI